MGEADLVFFYSTGHSAHFEHGHPERPERLESIRRVFEESGWWSKFPHLDPLHLPDEVLIGVHSPAYLAFLKQACSQHEPLDMDTYTTIASWQLALNAAGGAAAVASSVWNGEARRGFALCRPPGHHATSRHGMGFCLLNNIALAAEYLLRCHADSMISPDRLAIIDLDLHHGNGTQDIFYERDDVFYLSTHQSPLYPGSGHLEERGVGKGFGLTANFPLPPGTGDKGYRAVMQELILPLLNGYRPQMLLVSVGYDVHWRDPLGSMLLTADGFGHLIADLCGWADQNCSGKIVLILEGGYDLMAGQACGMTALCALLGEEWIDPLGPPQTMEANEWLSVVRKAKAIWEIPQNRIE
jgi:acetoin utilization deacetylase AcuC-like enzyme